MAYQKVIPYLLIAVVAIAITQVSSFPKTLDRYAANGNQYHDLIVGSRRPGDKIIINQRVTNTSAAQSAVQKQYFLQRGQVITLLRVVDLAVNGTGGYASIVKGGPGWNNVTLQFRSQWRYGFNFSVNIYGK